MRFFVLKKQNISVVLAVVLAVLIATFAISSPMIVYAVREVKNIPTIVIDAGHGGADAGVVGKTTGLRESDLNLEIALMLGEMLKGAGYNVVYTRTSDVMLNDVQANTRKRRDMFSRAKIINNAGANVVVSIHMNYYPSSSRRGAQTFFERKDEKSFALATVVQDELNELNLANTQRTYSPLTADKYILSCSSAASIIVECGFLSNPYDEQLLTSAEYRARIAEAIAQGIREYFSI